MVRPTSLLDHRQHFSRRHRSARFRTDAAHLPRPWRRRSFFVVCAACELARDRADHITRWSAPPAYSITASTSPAVTVAPAFALMLRTFPARGADDRFSSSARPVSLRETGQTT